MAQCRCYFLKYIFQVFLKIYLWDVSPKNGFLTINSINYTFEIVLLSLFVVGIIQTYQSKLLPVGVRYARSLAVLLKYIALNLQFLLGFGVLSNYIDQIALIPAMRTIKFQRCPLQFFISREFIAAQWTTKLMSRAS